MPARGLKVVFSAAATGRWMRPNVAMESSLRLRFMLWAGHSIEAGLLKGWGERKASWLLSNQCCMCRCSKLPDQDVVVI